MQPRFVNVTILSLLLFLPHLARAQEKRGAELDEPAFAGVELFRNDDENFIFIAIAEGAVTPRQALLALNDPADIELTIVSGPARFLHIDDETGELKELEQVRYRSDVVWLPELTSGVAKKESLLSILVNGKPACSNLRIGPLEPGLMDLWLLMKSAAPGVLRLDEALGFVVADPMRFDYEELPQDIDEIQRELGSPTQNIYNPDGERCPELVWLHPTIVDSFPTGLCLTYALPTGKVEFQGVTNPQAEGYSVKPETSSALVWAQGPSIIGIDGLYRHSWHCGIALKVPDNIVATVFGDSASCCKGYLAALAFKKCTWIDPRTLSDWPDCPL